MKRSLLLSIALIALDQAIKLAVSIFSPNARIILIPGVLQFEPSKNVNLNWFASMAGYHTPVWMMVAFQLAVLAIIVLAFRYFTFRAFSRQRVLQTALSFGAAGVCCSFIDVVFWGGSLDFMGLFNWFIFDTKDLFLNTALVMLIFWSIWYEKEKERKQIPGNNWRTILQWLRHGCPVKRPEGQKG